jgi:hypothetical protein
MTSSLPFWLGLVLPNVPFWLVWGAGLLIALLTWRKHPPVSLTAFLAFALLLATSVAGTAAHAWVIEQQFSRGWTSAQTGTTMSLIGLARTVFGTAGHVLLLVAVFAWRSQRAPSRLPALPEDDRDRPRHPGHTGIQPHDPLS